MRRFSNIQRIPNSTPAHDEVAAAHGGATAMQQRLLLQSLPAHRSEAAAAATGTLEQYAAWLWPRLDPAELYDYFCALELAALGAGDLELLRFARRRRIDF